MQGLSRLFGWSKQTPAVMAGTDRATEDDIRACFRLILGREPNPEECAGHFMQAGQPLPGVVAGYLNSLEFARRALLRPLTDDVQIAERPAFRLYAARNDALIGRHVLDGSYEPEIEAVFRSVLRPGMTVIDIGANIGFFSMLSASIVGAAGHVLAVEPNPANARMIEASRRLNGFGQIVTAQVAAGRRTGLLVLNTSHSNGTTSAPLDDPSALLQAQTVACVALDALIDPGRRVDLIKVDAEGAEYNALLGAAAVLARDRPIIITEFSPGMLRDISAIDGPGYLAWLSGLGYALSVIQPDGSPTAAGQDSAAIMAAYVRRGTDHIDLLAVPA